jgi:AAA+ superfamily predicted ATPase
MAATRRGLILANLEGEVGHEMDALGPVAGIAPVGEEWWAWTQTRLHRFSQSGQSLGSSEHPPLPPGRPIVSPYWSRGAVWAGDTSIRFSLQGDTVIRDPDEPAFVLPVEPRSQLVVRGTSAGLRRDGAFTWSRKLFDTGRVVGGSVLFEARLLALVVAETRPEHDEHRILTIDLRQGKVGHVLRVRNLVGWAFAAHRGQVVVDNAERLLVIDLRFGTVVHEWALAASHRELAVDPELRQIVILDDDDKLTTLDGGGLIVSTQSVSETPAVIEEPAAPEPEPVATPLVVTLPTTAPTALWPRVDELRTTREESVTILDHHVTYVATLAARAIALMWDSGRLARSEDNHLPFYSEVVGILQVERGRARDEVGEAEQRCRLAYDRMIERIRSVGDRRAPLAVLAREFELSPLATQILVVIAAPILRGELARLYGILTNDRQRALVDELTVCQVLAGSASRADITRELDRDSPLRRFGLVVAAETMPRPFHSLSIDSLVMRRLRDLPLDSDVEPWLQPLAATRSYDQLRVPHDVLARFLTAVHGPADPRKPIRLVVRGRTSSGRRTVLAAIAAAAGRTLGVLDVSRGGQEPGMRALALREGLRRAMLRGWFPCVEGLDDVSEHDRAMREEVMRVLADHPGPLSVRLPHGMPPPVAPGYLQLDLPMLAEEDRRAAWTEVVTRHTLAVTDVDLLASRYRVGVGVVERVCAQVATAGSTRDDAARIEALIKQHLQSRFGELAQQVTRLATWSDVILPTDVKDSVLELIARVRHRRRVYEEWGFDRTMSTSRGLTALFAGPPGTGKTMVAGVIANELGLDLHRIDLSRVVSKWIGETERNLGEAFDAAEDGRAILLFDEADSLFAKRTEVKTSTDRYANLEVNYLLQRLDTFEGFAILTTNFGGAIDPAFKRRLTLRLTFPFPDEDMREQLWRVHIPAQVPRQGELDLRALARRFTMSGGYVRNSVLRAAFLASEEGSPLTQQHLERAVALEFREIGKLSETGTLE